MLQKRCSHIEEPFGKVAQGRASVAPGVVCVCCRVSQGITTFLKEVIPPLVIEGWEHCIVAAVPSNKYDCAEPIVHRIGDTKSVLDGQAGQIGIPWADIGSRCSHVLRVQIWRSNWY